MRVINIRHRLFYTKIYPTDGHAEDAMRCIRRNKIHIHQEVVFFSLI